MKTSCEVIRDLLPLYHDEACSNESRTLVDEHLGECPDCQKILVEMDAPVPATENTDDRAILEHLAGTVNKRKKRAVFKRTIITAMVCAALFGAYWGLTQWTFIPIGSTQMVVSDVCELRNGMIAYRVSYLGAGPQNYRFLLAQDGNYYQAPYRAIIPTKQLGNKAGEWQLVDRSEHNSWQENHGGSVRLQACYIGTPKDRVLLWKEGIELPPASEAVEALWNFPEDYPRNY